MKWAAFLLVVVRGHNRPRVADGNAINAVPLNSCLLPHRVPEMPQWRNSSKWGKSGSAAESLG